MTAKIVNLGKVALDGDSGRGFGGKGDDEQRFHYLQARYRRRQAQ